MVCLLSGGDETGLKSSGTGFPDNVRIGFRLFIALLFGASPRK